MGCIHTASCSQTWCMSIPSLPILSIKLIPYLYSFPPQVSPRIYHGIKKTAAMEYNPPLAASLAGSTTRFANSRTATTDPPQALTSNPAVPAAVAASVRSTLMKRGTRALETKQTNMDTMKRTLVVAAGTPDTAVVTT